jgi:nuclear GTP-binding protein
LCIRHVTSSHDAPSLPLHDNRKIKKEGNRAKKTGFGAHLKNKKKDPGIPNDYPHKAELLKEIERAKLALEERKEAQKQGRKDARKAALSVRRGLGSAAGMVSAGSSLPGLAEAVASRAAAFNAAAEVSATMEKAAEGTAKSQTGGEGQASRRAYLKELRKVLETADVVLQVQRPSLSPSHH